LRPPPHPSLPDALPTSDAPSNHTDLVNLSFLAEHLIVDNTANPAGVNWEVDNGDTLGYVQTGTYTSILSLNGAGDVQIQAGSSSDRKSTRLNSSHQIIS